MKPTHLARALRPVLAVAVLWGSSGCEDEQTLAPATETAVGAFPAALEKAIASAGDDLGALLQAGTTEINAPAVITEPGVYRVVADFLVTAAVGDGIVIRSDHVLLLLGDHVLTGPGNKAGRGIVLENVEHVLVSGGILETFGTGVALLGTRRSAVRRVRIEGGDETAAPPANPPQVGLLLVNSAYNHIRHNRIAAVNLGIFVRGGGSAHNRVHHNQAVAGDHGLLGICYNPAEGEGPAGPHADDVRLNRLDGFGVGIQTSAGSVENSFRLNTIRYLERPWQDFNGTNVFRHNRTAQIVP